MEPTSVCGLSRYVLGLLAMCAAPGLVCPPGSAQSDIGGAVVAVRQGRVDVMRDAEPWALSVGDVVKPRQVVVTGPDGYAEFRLADGSTFQVFANSQVTFRSNLANWTDLLDVWIGRVKVQIQKLGGKPNPNRIATPTAIISVRGTIFDVSVEDDRGTTYVMVEEGLVDVRHRLQPGKTIPLAAGEAIRVFDAEPLAVNKIDRGALAKSVARAASDILAQILMRRTTGLPGNGGGSIPSGGGGGSVGEEKAPEAPAPPPPPPPPPQ